jgi:hypothetical protein
MPRVAYRVLNTKIYTSTLKNALAYYVHRIGSRFRKVSTLSSALCGKFSFFCGSEWRLNGCWPQKNGNKQNSLKPERKPLIRIIPCAFFLSGSHPKWCNEKQAKVAFAKGGQQIDWKGGFNLFLKKRLRINSYKIRQILVKGNAYTYIDQSRMIMMFFIALMA